MQRAGHFLTNYNWENGKHTNMSNDVMSLYWELASVDPSVRQQAADTLLQALHKFQHAHEQTKKEGLTADGNWEVLCAQDVSYGLKRLLRGLPSSREGARQGFAVALTEVGRKCAIPY